MKFLIFNLIVGFAPIYLFSGEGVDFQAVPKKAMAATDTIKSKLMALTDIPKKPKEDTSPKAPAPVAISLDKPEPAPEPALKLAETKPIELDPAISERRNEVLESAVPLPSEFAAQDKGLVFRQDRQKALIQLAEDMEFFSAEAMSR